MSFPLHAQRAGAQQLGPARINLGEEDPLYIVNRQKGPPDRRRVSLRWLAGSVLTALFSVALIGGALQVAIGVDAHDPVSPAMARTRAAEPATMAVARKGDRVRPAPPAETFRRVIQVSTMSRQADRNLIRVRPFAHIRSGLASPEGERFADLVPKYEPLRIFSESIEEPVEVAEAETIYGADVEGEVTIQVSDLQPASVMFDDKAELTAAEVERSVLEVAPFLAAGAIEATSIASIDPARFEVAGTGLPMPSSLTVAIVPENVSLVQKSEGALFDTGVEEKTIPVTEGSALIKLLQEAGSTEGEARQIQAALVANFSFDFRAGQSLRLGLAMDPEAEGAMRPIRVSLYGGQKHLATVARSDMGGFVPAQEPPPLDGASAPEEGSTRVSRGALPTVYAGIWRTGLAMEMPRPLIERLVQAFSFDIDFQGRVTPSDGLEVIYTADGEEGEGEILYASLTLNGVERRLYRFRAPDDGTVDFYDAEGKSAKKFLMRKPMTAGTFRSTFGMRRHPILGRYKMHTGVDWAARSGTPIMAAGNGTIVHAGWKGGYGKHIRIQHSNGYETTYSHLSGFAKGIKAGARVVQGQIIGQTGSTGLSTGPHLHYEVLVNKRFVDPMKIKLPRGRVLQGGALTTFEKERARVDALLARDEEAVRTARTGG